MLTWRTGVALFTVPAGLARLAVLTRLARVTRLAGFARLPRLTMCTGLAMLPRLTGRHRRRVLLLGPRTRFGRRFGGVRAVHGVDLEIRQGERRAVLGPNGAGKTTLFNVIAGEFPPSEGTIELFGVDVTRKPARARVPLGVTRTYQISRLFAGLTVADNLYVAVDRKSTRLNSSHSQQSRMPSSA